MKPFFLSILLFCGLPLIAQLHNANAYMPPWGVVNFAGETPIVVPPSELAMVQYFSANISNEK